MANLAITVDHEAWKDVVEILQGVRTQPRGTNKIAVQNIIDTIETGIQTIQPAYKVPTPLGPNERKKSHFPD
jgi:hypothetical protein